MSAFPDLILFLPVHPHSLIRMQVRMTSKYHNHRTQTNPPEAQNNSCHTTAMAQLEISSSDDCKSR